MKYKIPRVVPTYETHYQRHATEAASRHCLEYGHHRDTGLDNNFIRYDEIYGFVTLALPRLRGECRCKAVNGR